MRMRSGYIFWLWGVAVIMTGFLPGSSRAGKYRLEINIRQLRNDKGNIILYLYNRPGTIPDKHFNKYYKKAVIPAGKNATTVFFDLPYGEYAVNAIHDENGNGKIDKGFLLPVEGLGFTNFETISLRNRPDFIKAKFLLQKDSAVTIRMIYL